VQEGALLHGALLAYLMPLLLVCIGGFVGAMLGGSRAASDLYGVLGAIAGLVLGFALVHRFGRVVGQQPTMLRRAKSMIIRQCSR
jgi:positive regulator of sigma E activity